ncbi:hypothetical protein NOR53_1624 [gamma proteobacterium NOR5-3]|nr:hypothetical protein NOR53_1624 [gamma proteobacterium NOR5-3]
MHALTGKNRAMTRPARATAEDCKKFATIDVVHHERFV